MAFKREGNDKNWLNVLQKRRVAELFAEDIPEDEAHLMKNGRFACMVCQHRPVFDTVNMLAVHRQGKKHQNNVELEAAEIQEIEALKRKREHEHFMKHGTLPQWSTSVSHNPGSILPSAPYDPRVKKRVKVKPHERRPVVDLEPVATTSDSLPGNQAPPQTISQYRRQQKMKSANSVSAKPYIRKFPITNANVKSQQIREESSRIIGAAESKCGQPNPESSNQEQGSGVLSPPQNPGSSKSTHGGSHEFVHKKQHPPSKKKKALPVYGPPVNEEKVKKAEQYLQARGSGWKKDLDGKWIKEEDVEFDSDEEPPDLS